MCISERNLELWLGGCGLVGEWFCYWVRTTPPTAMSLLSHARQRTNLLLQLVGVFGGGG